MKRRRRKTVDVHARVQLLTNVDCLIQPVVSQLRRAGFRNAEVHRTPTTCYLSFNLMVKPEVK